MAKATDKVEAPEPVTTTPKELAEELGVDAKRIRAFLRQDMTRAAEAKNTSWILSAEQADAVRERFTPSEDDEDGSDDES
jgi:predicted transcriptional regulator